MTDWIDWNGGECPVPEGTLVDVRFVNGVVSKRSGAEGWGWRHEEGDYNIAAYRVHVPAPDVAKALAEALKKSRVYVGMVRSSDIADDDPIFEVIDEIDAALALYREGRS
jgi:hypothetical protein